MILELFLIGKLLDSTVETQSTPKAVSPAKKTTVGSKATLGGAVLPVLDVRAPVTIRPDQVAERYYRRPKGLN